MLLRRTLLATLGILLLTWSLALPAANAQQCKSKWTLATLPTSPELAFGVFSLDDPSFGGTVAINSAGTISSSTNVLPVLSSTGGVYVAEIGNTLAGCEVFTDVLSLSWSAEPVTMAEAGGTTMGISTLVSAVDANGTVVLNGATLPSTVFQPNLVLPITVTVYGILTAAINQTPGVYSGSFTLQLDTGAQAKTAAGISSASVYAPMGITELWPMDFGTVAGGSNSGSVNMDTAGVRSITGDGQVLAVGPGTAASFKIIGEPSRNYGISFSAEAVLASPAGDLISASAFTHNGSGIVPVGGSETFQVGATLNLGPIQAAGSYSSSNPGGAPYTVTVNYE